jgi:hypothetical protein
MPCSSRLNLRFRRLQARRLDHLSISTVCQFAAALALCSLTLEILFHILFVRVFHDLAGR